jgi:glycosyltransferase involved in cell wall biosynthesis
LPVPDHGQNDLKIALRNDLHASEPMHASSPPADRSAAMPRLRVGLAMPGGFEFGGIGRTMLYATEAWKRLPDAPGWRLVDARGRGSLALMPLHLAAAATGIAADRVLGRLDLLHLNVAGRGSTWRKILLGELAGLLGLPTVVHLHDFDYAADLERRGPLGRRLAARLFRRARRVIVLGERDRRTVVERLGVPPERVELLHNGVPDPGPPPARTGRAGPVRLLFLGHLDARKGVPELLTALAGPALRARDWRLVLAGGGETERFAAMVEELGLAGRVELTGWLPHERVYGLCREADLFVLPSHAEGQAMSLLEAMAHGLAIVTTPVGAHLETVQDGVEALLVPPGDSEALGLALARLIDDGALRARLGQAARARYQGSFTADHYARGLAAIHGRALAAPPRQRTLVFQRSKKSALG